MLIIFLSVEVLICSFYTLNLFLRGRLKQILEGFLCLSILLMAILAFIFLGWKWGLCFVALPFLLIGVSRPFAQALAYKILGYRTGVDDDSGFDIMTELGKGEKGFKKAMARLDREDKQNQRRLKTIAQSSDINFVLSKHGFSFSMFYDVLKKLRASALHDLAWEIVSSPKELDEYIEMKNSGKSDADIWSHFWAIK